MTELDTDEKNQQFNCLNSSLNKVTLFNVLWSLMSQCASIVPLMTQPDSALWWSIWLYSTLGR